MSPELFNQCEGAFWILLGAAFLVSAFLGSQASLFHLKILTSVSLIAFGLSDWMEVRTGAWWRPWWLLAWKASCIASLGFCSLRYRKLGKSGDH